MHMKIDKSGREKISLKIDNLFAHGRRLRPNSGDQSIFNEQIESVAHSIWKNQPPVLEDHGSGRQLRLPELKSILDPTMEENFGNRRSKFAVESIFWRKAIDWSVRHIPAGFHRPLIWIAAFFFFFLAGRARKALLRNLRLTRPRSLQIAN